MTASTVHVSNIAHTTSEKEVSNFFSFCGKITLLESGNAKEALSAFEATLKKEPNRLAAYVGAAKAAEKAGDVAKAQEYYKKVVAIAGDADKSRVEVGEARAFLTKKS
jgi:Tfp pilus assembly protein PilF